MKMVKFDNDENKIHLSDVDEFNSIVLRKLKCVHIKEEDYYQNKEKIEVWKLEKNNENLQTM